MSGFSNKPKILRGAFVEYGLSIPPLFVVFQFNPVELTRNRSLSFAPPNDVIPCPARRIAEESEEDETETGTRPRWSSLREYHKETELDDIQEGQRVTVQEETVSFDIRLDATDKLNDGDAIAGQFGIAPELSTLELMVHPKEESLLGAAMDALLGTSEGFSFTRPENPPMVLFIWGLKRIVPVNINSLNIRETEFNTMLDPVRAVVSVNLTVVEGKNLVYKYTKAMKEVMSVLNLANIADIADVVVPG